MQRVFSGVKPSGLLTIGNYIGAIRQFLDLQNKCECFFCVVDLHALTVPQDPIELRQNTLDLAALYLAMGLNPDKATVFVQSHVPAHAEMAWLLQTITHVGQLRRMTQFKNKARKGGAEASSGLFTYPVLMAADILLYQADLVPVGEDQKQHLELTRDVAKRFNRRFGQTLQIPDAMILSVGGRIMSLTDPGRKMDKSDPDPNGYISIIDPPDVISQKIRSAVTDSGEHVRYDPNDKPAISNLIVIYSQFTGESVKSIEKRFDGAGYSPFKEALAEVVIEGLRLIQRRYSSIRASNDVERILSEGANKAKEVSEPVLELAKERMGLIVTS